MATAILLLTHGGTRPLAGHYDYDYECDYDYDRDSTLSGSRDRDLRISNKVVAGSSLVLNHNNRIVVQKMTIDGRTDGRMTMMKTMVVSPTTTTMMMMMRTMVVGRSKPRASLSNLTCSMHSHVHVREGAK